MKEEWKPVKGYEQQYDVSNFGAVRSHENKTRKGTRILKNTFSSGYFVVHLSKHGKKEMKRVHRLVAEAFCHRPPDCEVVDHIDTDTRNNRADNLKWTTTKGNSNNPLTKKHKSESKKGQKNPMWGVHLNNEAKRKNNNIVNHSKS